MSDMRDTRRGDWRRALTDAIAGAAMMVGASCIAGLVIWAPMQLFFGFDPAWLAATGVVGAVFLFLLVSYYRFERKMMAPFREASNG